MKYLALALLALSLTAGCHAQVPPATPQPSVVLNWTAPAASGSFTGCTSSQLCTYAVYRDSVSTTDPITSSNWKRIDAQGATTTGVAGFTYTDSSPASGNDAYAVETIWQNANSGPSNIVSVAVPVVAVPLAPSVSAPSVTALKELPSSTPNSPPTAQLVARLERR
jgi:hypothetical protein